MIERREKEDIEIQIYKDKLITPPPHYMDGREKPPSKISRISPTTLLFFFFIKISPTR